MKILILLSVITSLAACSNFNREEAVAKWEKYKEDHNCVPQRHLGPKRESMFSHPGGVGARPYGYAIYRCDDGKLTYSRFEYF